MKIEQIEIHHLRMPLKSAFETSFGRSVTRDCLFLRVYADGIEGFGECAADYDPGYSSETAGTSWYILQEFIFPKVIGMDFSHPADFQECVANVRGHRMAKAALEMALWDIYGKQNNQSLKNLLNGTKERVGVGVSVGIQKDPTTLVKTVAKYLEDGYQRIKIKIKPGRDIEDAKAVRSAFPLIRLQVDANSAYTLKDAQRLIPLDELNLLLIEQPLDEEDLWDHHKLQKMLRTPICLDESILSLQHARQALEMQSCRVINIKAGRVGGLSEGKKIHDYCYQQSVPVWCGGMLETGVGRASNLALASLPGFTLPGDISATDRYYDEDITNERFILNADSTIDVPSGVGLGITINEKAISKYSIRKYYAK